MSEISEQLYITDRDIFDLVASSKRRLTTHVLLELTQDRKIFCSRELSREDLAEYISVLPHDHNDLATLIERAESGARQEKVTFLEMPADVTIDDVRDAIKSYGEKLTGTDKALVPVVGKNSLTAQFDYDELDFSKNRLAQRQHKHAQIEVFKEDDKTLFRLPASEKAREIVESIRQTIALSKDTKIESTELSLAQLTSPTSRTTFFTTLIGSVPGYLLQTVTSLRVATFGSISGDDEIDDEVGEVSSEMLAVVNKVALGGENLIATEEFRQLSERGFFIVSITWRAIEEKAPYDLIKVSVSFDDPIGGEGIRYAIRQASRIETDRYSSSFKRLSDHREKNLLRLISESANGVISTLLSEEKSEKK